MLWSTSGSGRIPFKDVGRNPLTGSNPVHSTNVLVMIKRTISGSFTNMVKPDPSVMKDSDFDLLSF